MTDDVAAFFAAGPAPDQRLVWLPATNLAVLFGADTGSVLAAATARGFPIQGSAIGVSRTRALLVLRQLFERDAGG